MKELCENNKFIDKSLLYLEKVSCISKENRIERMKHLENTLIHEKQVDLNVKHMFTGNIYSRQITIPKNTLLISAVHKFSYFDIMLSGDISISTTTGKIIRLKGTHVMQGVQGNKRAGFAHEETKWVTFHSSEEKDPNDMRDFLTCASIEDYNKFHTELKKIKNNL